MIKFYHLHINIFEINEKTIQELEEVGYSNAPFIFVEDSYAPPRHYEFESSNKELIDDYWAKALELLNMDTLFKGYIEYETLTDNYSVNYTEDYKFQKDVLFPLPILKMIDVPISTFKQSDLHIKRTLELPYDELDTLLLKYGFYEVRTARHRLYTIQSENATDMIIIYQKLKDYFDQTGGVKALSLEFVNKLVRFPNDFELVKFIPKDFMSTQK